MIELAVSTVSGDTDAVLGRRLAVVAFTALLLVLGACRGSSDEVAVATPVAETPTATVVETLTDVPIDEPTTASIELTDEQRVAVALDAFDAESQPVELIAYDHLETTLDGTFVNVDVCGWTGDTVFDDIHRATYRTFVNAAGEAEALFVSTAKQAGDCQNSELIESALQSTREYDSFVKPILEVPDDFVADDAQQVMVQAAVDGQQELAEGFAKDGLSYLNHYLDGQLPTSSIVEVLTRSYRQEGFEVLELIACREIPDGFGLYRGDLLVDDFVTEQAQGRHVVSRYLITREEGRWKSLGVRENLNSDCFGFEQGWFEGINDLFPDAGPWERTA